MIQEALKHYVHTDWTCAGMLLFLAAFLLNLVLIYRSNNDELFRKMSALPLEESKGDKNGLK